MNDDLISRRDAIDAVCEHGTELERRGIMVLAVANHKQVTVDLLESLPSAQPDVPDTNVGDMISRQAAIDAVIPAMIDGADADMVEGLIHLLPSAKPEPQWIPIKTRPMNKEEIEYWSDHFGFDIEYEDAALFDCKMPDDGQEIIVSYEKWVGMDICEVDGGVYWLQGNGDWDGVLAWMPSPEPYKERITDE